MKIGIIGLGLIGGSLALDLRDRGHETIGVSRRPQTCQTALDRGVVDVAGVELSLLAETDVIFVCTPIAAIAPTVSRLVPHLAPETVVTDVGSVKVSVVEAVAPLWPNFVPAHPMAGTAESGIEAAQRHLFAGCPYAIAPLPTTPTFAVERVETLVASLGARIYRCTPQTHDRAVAWISHLPVIVSASAIDACLDEPDPDVLQLARALASSGFRDTTRVGGGNPELGVMMARYNRDSLLRSLHAYRQTLDRAIAAIESEDWPALETQLQRTHRQRPQFLNPSAAISPSDAGDPPYN